MDHGLYGYSHRHSVGSQCQPRAAPSGNGSERDPVLSLSANRINVPFMSVPCLRPLSALEPWDHRLPTRRFAPLLRGTPGAVLGRARQVPRPVEARDSEPHSALAKVRSRRGAKRLVGNLWSQGSKAERGLRQGTTGRALPGWDRDW